MNGVRLLADRAGISNSELTLVDESDRITHTDPTGVETSQNPLAESRVPFLQDIG